ncbi:MAG TPA: ABC transporter permease [Acidimicrobiales bacterium]|nr:ABC transporter permease [Acidimicrobiales bacterium]
MPDPLVTGLAARWQGLSARGRAVAVIGGLVVLYVAVTLVTGSHGWMHRRAPIGIVLLGVVYGSATALGAMGLILVYRANRFINFAHGALGSMVGVIAIGLVQVHGLDYWIALPLATAVGAGVGGLTEVLAIRRFRGSPRLILLVASIGLAQVFGGLELAGSKAIHFVSLLGSFSPPFNLSVRVDVYTFQSNAVMIVLVVPLVIGFLAWFLLRTAAGVAVRAAAENSDRALLLGIPVNRLSTIVWVIAGGLAALTYMLQAPFEGVKPGAISNGPTVLVPMLAAAVVARMESLPLAFGAAVGLGIIEQLVRWNNQNDPSLIWAVYLVVILLALLVQSGKLSRAKESGDSSWAAVAVTKPVPDELRHLPEVTWSRRLLGAGLVAAMVLVPHSWTPSSQLLAGFAVVWAMVGVSLVVLTGWGGQISLGQFGFAGVAGMVAGNMVARWNVDFLFVLVAAGLTGAVTALLIGLPALRIKGLFLAATTLAMGVALDQYFLNTDTFPSFIPADGVPRPLLLQRFDLNDYYQMYVVCLVLLGLSILAVHGLRKSRAGRVLIATNDNERAAASASVPTTGVKLSGFVTAGVIAGVAGAMDVLLLGALNPGSFPAIDSITVFCYSVIGGLGSVSGTLIGILSFKYLETLTWLGTYRETVSGAALLLVLLFLPGGLGQLVFSARDRLLRMVADRRGILVPSLVADKRQPAGAEAGLLTTAMSTGGAGGAGAAAADAPSPPGRRRSEEEVGV